MPKFIPQTFLFPRKEWSRSTLKNWLRVNGYKYESITLEGDHYRARQFDPKRCGRYYTQTWKSRRTAGGAGRHKPKKVLAVFCRRR